MHPIDSFILFCLPIHFISFSRQSISFIFQSRSFTSFYSLIFLHPFYLVIRLFAQVLPSFLHFTLSFTYFVASFTHSFHYFIRSSFILFPSFHYFILLFRYFIRSLSHVSRHSQTYAFAFIRSSH